MKIHYTTRQTEVPEALRKKVEGKLQKIHKILGERHEAETHVILSLERHLHHAEVTLHHRHHTLVVEAAGADLAGAMLEAAGKLEKQVLRNKERWRTNRRRSKTGVELEPPAASDGRGRAAAARAFTPRVYRSRPAPKPLTEEEAVLEMQLDDRECVVYRDADKGRVAVIFRRRDGHLEVVEG